MEIESLKKEFNLEKTKLRKEELEKELSNAHSTGKNISALSQELTHYTTLHTLLNELFKKIDRYTQAENMLKDESDEQLLEMAGVEIEQLESEIEDIRNQILQTEIERELADPDDGKPVVIEVRAGPGGAEATLFAADLFRMYSNFAKNQGWSVEIVDSSISENGGYKEVVALINGKGAYKALKYESGVHRVQRIPVTESSGRIHTSTASVAVLPQVEDIEIQIDPKELRIDVMRASGPGGQSVNKTDSAVRITHLPSGIVVSCRETKYQDQNKVKAMNLLKSRLYDHQKEQADMERSGMRSSQIGSAKRAEKIRTYNFPQSRITDHRVKVSWHDLESILSGEISELIETVSNEIQKIEIAKKRK